MSVLLPILLALLAAPPTASDTLGVSPSPARAVKVTTGSAHTLSVSGTSGTVTTRMPGNDAILLGMDIDESGDAPCEVELYWWRENGDSAPQGIFETTFTLCGTPFNASGLVAVGHDSGSLQYRYFSAPEYVYYAAHGVRTCHNRAGTRVKGVRLFGSTINQDNDREVRRDPALKRDFERTNCNTWQTVRKCPAGEVVVGIDIHTSGTSITGLAPKCATVSVVQDNSAGTRRSN
ncbi:MAG: hypothetical protein Rubg2KO_07670 [Rubricoccaceae bacterium]